MSEYVLLAKQLSDNLAACGHAINASDLQQYILSGLDSAYDSIVTTPTFRNDDVNMEDFQAHMLSFDLYLKSHNSILSSAAAANMARSGSASFQRTNNANQHICCSSINNRNNGSRNSNQS